MVEIEASKTIRSSIFDKLDYLQSLAGTNNVDRLLAYGGDVDQRRSDTYVASWRML